MDQRTFRWVDLTLASNISQVIILFKLKDLIFSCNISLIYNSFMTFNYMYKKVFIYIYNMIKKENFYILMLLSFLLFSLPIRKKNLKKGKRIRILVLKSRKTFVIFFLMQYIIIICIGFVI